MSDINNENVNLEPVSAPQVKKPKHSLAKRILIPFVAILFALGAIAGGAYIITQDNGTEELFTLSYAPWPDLGEHYDLSCVTTVEDTLSYFNSHELSHDRVPFMGIRPSDEGFDAKVVGKGVWVRSYPKLKSRHKLCQVKMGDELRVVRSVGHMDGKNWYYVEVKSGRRAGYEGYICSDYIIEQEGYDLLERFVFNDNSTLNKETPVKYLRALSSIMLRLGATAEYSNLSVQLLDTTIYEHHTVLTFQIRDLNVAENSSLLAFVQYLGEDEDYVVIGIVPGSNVCKLQHCENCSFDIYYN